MAFHVNDIRARFPALARTHNGKKVAYLDGPGGTQVLGDSINATARYMMRGGANLHGSFPSSEETEELIESAKSALSDFLAVEEREIAFGPNMTTLALAVARALTHMWSDSGGEIVVSELDHRANVDPWLHIAKDLGMTVRWLQVDTETLTLDLSDLNSVINSNTKLVAVGFASNAVGTINDVKKISKAAKREGALVAVDAVHAAPHLVIDRDDLGADILLCSAYKFFGPHVGVVAIKSNLFEQLNTYKLIPAPSYIPDKLETGTQNHEGIAGISECVEFIASCGNSLGNRRDRIVSGLEEIQSHENLVIDKIREELLSMDKVHVYSASSDIDKTPTIAFRVDGIEPQAVCRYMSDYHGIFIADGHFYASTLAEKLGIAGKGGWIRAGLAPYNTVAEGEELVRGIKELCA